VDDARAKTKEHKMKQGMKKMTKWKKDTNKKIM